MPLARFVPAWEGGNAQFVAAWESSGTELTVEVNIDTGNIFSGSVDITDAGGSTPTVQVSPRTASAGNWRHFLFQINTANGKRPTFRVNEANINGMNMQSTWRPMWTTDFVTWNLFPSFSRDGDYLVFQDDTAFTDNTVFIASHPVFRQADAATLTSSLLSESFAEPTLSANSQGVYFNTVAEVDENDRPIGQNDMYSIKLDWGGSTSDGARKRVGVLLCGVHAGEIVDGEGLKGFLDWVKDDTSQAAQDFRANWILYLYFNITPNGRFGGHNRTNFRSTQDPNRDWDTAPLSEQAETQAAISADLDLPNGPFDAMLSFHGWRTDNEFLYYYPHNHDAAVESAWETAFKSFEDTTGNFEKAQFPSSAYAEATWGVDQGATLSIVPEFNHRGNSDPARYRQMGSYFARAVQILDADETFVAASAGPGVPTNLQTTNITQTSARLSWDAPT